MIEPLETRFVQRFTRFNAQIRKVFTESRRMPTTHGHARATISPPQSHLSRPQCVIGIHQKDAVVGIDFAILLNVQSDRRTHPTVRRASL